MNRELDPGDRFKSQTEPPRITQLRLGFPVQVVDRLRAVSVLNGDRRCKAG